MPGIPQGRREEPCPPDTPASRACAAASFPPEYRTGEILLHLLRRLAVGTEDRRRRIGDGGSETEDAGVLGVTGHPFNTEARGIGGHGGRAPRSAAARPSAGTGRVGEIAQTNARRYRDSARLCDLAYPSAARSAARQIAERVPSVPPCLRVEGLSRYLRHLQHST